APTLPTQIPAAERTRLQEVADAASVSARAAGEPFVARPEVFEFLLDHPEFATHVTRALRLARYRIWRGPEGLWLDDGWGAIGQFSVVYAAGGSTRTSRRGISRSSGACYIFPSAAASSLRNRAISGFSATAVR